MAACITTTELGSLQLNLHVHMLGYFVLHVYETLFMGDFHQCSYKKHAFYEHLIGDVKKGNASADHCGTDKLTKCAKNEGFDPEMSAQFDELKIQIKGTRAEIQPPIKTHDEKSNDSAATTATSGKAAAGWHYAEFCSFKQQTQEKFEEKAQEIHDLEQLIRNSDKNQQDQTKVLASKTLEVLKELKETQAEISRSVTKIDENSSGMKEAIEQLRTKQERHGQILEELKRMNDEKAIKNQLEKIQQGCQVSQEAHLTRLEPIQVQMIITQLKEALQNMHS